MADPMTRDAMIAALQSVQASCHACRWRDEVSALASVIAALRTAPPADAGAPPALVALVRRQVELLGQCEAFIAEQFDADDGDAVALSNSIHAIRRTLDAGTSAPPAAPPAPCVGCRGRGVVGGYAPVAYGEGIVGSEVIDVPCPDCAPAAPPALSVEDAHAARSLTAPPAVQVGEPMPETQDDVCECGHTRRAHAWASTMYLRCYHGRCQCATFRRRREGA